MIVEELRKLLNDPFGDDAVLTDREREVANLLALAHKGVEVAVKLGISPTTVSVLSGRAKAKLGGKPFTRLLLERIKAIVG